MSDLIRILVAPLFWLAAFSALYGLQGLACSQHSDLPNRLGIADSPLLIAAGIVGLIAQTAVLVALPRWPSQSPFVARVSVLLGWTALAAMIWTFFPVLLTSGCD